MTDTDMISDLRPIECLAYIGQSGRVIVGREKVTRIEPYCENGQMAPQPWFAVYQDDFLWQRIPAYAVTVQYKGGKHRRGDSLGKVDTSHD